MPEGGLGHRMLIAHVTFAKQVQEAQSRRLDESQAVRAAALLPLDFSALLAGLEDGSLSDLDAITEQLLGLSRAAADRLAEEQGTGGALPWLS